MSDKYDQLKKLAELNASGILSDAEYQQEKQKLLNDAPPPVPKSNAGSNNSTTPPKTDMHVNLGMEEKTYILLMHGLQLISSFIAPLIMWLIKRDESDKINKHGVMIMNFQITVIIAFFANFILSAILVAMFRRLYALHFIPMLIHFAIIIYYIIAVAMAAINQNDNKPVKYPFSLELIKLGGGKKTI